MAARWVFWLAKYFACAPGEVLVVLATLLVVFATILLVWGTLKSVRAIRAQSKAAVRPAVVLRWDDRRAVLVNCGKGLALNVSAWITDGPLLLSHQCAADIGIGDTHRPPTWVVGWKGRPAWMYLGKGYRFYIVYCDAEGDHYYSYRDENQQWQAGAGDIPRWLRHPLVGKGRAMNDRTGTWERASPPEFPLPAGSQQNGPER